MRTEVNTNTSKGLTLVELLIALVIGFTLLNSVIYVFTSNLMANNLVSSYSSQQENSRIAVDSVAYNLRLAGHYGGVNADDISVLGTLGITGVGSCNQTWVTDIDFPLRGYEGASAISSVTNLPSGCIPNDQYIADSDLFVLRYASPTDTDPIGSLDASTIYLRSSMTNGITGGEILRGSNGSNTQIGSGVDGVGAYNYVYKTDLYYLRPCSALNGTSCTDGIPTLVKLTLDGNTMVSQAIAENIEQFQLEYGVDTNGDYVAESYEIASAVTNWGQIVSVKFSVVVRSEQREDSLNDNSTYTLAGGYSYTPSSVVRKHNRKVRTRVVQLRNMSRG